MHYALAAQLANAKTLDDLATLMEEWLKSYGFAGFVYWTHFRLPIEKVSAENAFLVSRGPAYLKAFEAIYFGTKLYVEDPIAHYAAKTSTPFTSQEIRAKKSEIKPNRRLRWLYALENKFGFNHDIYIPLHTPLRVQVFYAYFLGNDPSYPEAITKFLPQLLTDAALFSSCISDFIVLGGDVGDDLLFTRREQECLAWMAKGRSNLDIAKVLGISERTVKFHVKNIMKKLDADNRTEAVALAARSGWITN